MGIWFNKRGEEYYGETEKNWWKGYIDRLLKEHREKTPIDHPDGSVTVKKLADNSVTDEKIGIRKIKIQSGTTYAGDLSGHIGNLYQKAEESAANMSEHISDTNNPHSVTKSQVGLGSVPNVTTNNQTPTYTESANLTNITSGEYLSAAFGKIKKAITELISHIGNKTNPHAVTKSQVGLGNVDDTSDLNKPISAATQTALNGKQATITGGASSITGSNLTANRALISNSSGKVAVSDITNTELGYLDGVTGNIQTQLNNESTNRTAADTEIKNIIGNKGSLETENSDSIVEAINELVNTKMVKFGTIDITSENCYPTESATLDGVFAKSFSEVGPPNADVGDYDVYIVKYGMFEEDHYGDAYSDSGVGFLFVSYFSDNDSIEDCAGCKQVYIDNTGDIKYRVYSKRRYDYNSTGEWDEWRDTWQQYRWLYLGNVINEKQATETDFKLVTDIYPVDTSKVGSDNNILYITISNITSFSDLDGKVIYVYTGIYSNNKTQTVWLNVNGYGAKPIRRIVPDNSYENSTYNAYEINRYTVMQLYISGTSVYWVNPTVSKSSLKIGNVSENPDATDGVLIKNHLSVTDGICRDDDLKPGWYSVCAGASTNIASGRHSACFGGYDDSGNDDLGNAAIGEYSFIGGGSGNTANGNYSFIGGGSGNTAKDFNCVFGKYNSEPTAGDFRGVTGDAFIVGIGDPSVSKNGFRVDYAGNCYAAASMNSTGADYAECFEWVDKNPDNEDRVGYMTAFEGDKIRLASENDPIEIQGVVSALPAVVGDNYADEWHGKYLKDKYGRLLTEHKVYEAEYKDVEVDEEVELTADEISAIQEEITNDETLTDDEKTVKLSKIPTTKTVKVTKRVLEREAYEADEYILNPDYNADEEYVPRLKRKEYSAVGTHGKLAVRDDGTCVAGGFCRSGGGGIATASESGFYVMERIDEETVRIYIK